MHYIVSIHYPSLREIHSTLHADPAAALAEYIKHIDASERDAALFPPGRTVSVSEVVSVGEDFGYTNILKQGQLEKMVKRFEGLADEPSKGLLEIAKSNPSALTEALRIAGHFVYLVTPGDIVDHADQNGEKFTAEEVAEATRECQNHLADIPPFGDICDCVLDTARTIREENGKAGK
jgi:hypothetical protein